MKRVWFIFLIFAFFLVGCKPIGGLGIVAVNESKPLKADVEDYFQLPGEEEPIETSEVPNYIVWIEFVYTYAGYGLPTINPYTAKLTEYEIIYKRTDGQKFGNTIKGGCNIEVPADIEGKKTTKAQFTIAPRAWIEENPDLWDGIDLIANVTFTGEDKISGKKVSCEGKLLVHFKDYEDDPTKKGE